MSTAPAGRSVAPFFALTFAFTWLLQLPALLAQRGLLGGRPEPFMPLAMLGIFGPLVAATLLASREGGRPAVRQLYAGFRLWRAPLTCYLVALVLPALLFTAILWLLGLAGRQGPIAYPPGAGKLLAGVVISFAEEVGWRGFALPRLQRRMSPFAASGVLGVLWMAWHIPMFVGVGVPLSLLPLMGLYFIGGSLVFTWIYNRSGGSLWLAFLAHLAIHLDNAHAALPADVIPLLVAAITLAALGIALMRRSLTRPARPGRGRRAGRIIDVSSASERRAPPPSYRLDITRAAPCPRQVPASPSGCSTR